MTAQLFKGSDGWYVPSRFPSMPQSMPWLWLSGLVVITLCLAAPAQAEDNVSEESTDGSATELQEIVVESTSEPLTERPLGIGISGRTLRQTAGSGGDPLRTLQSLPGLVFTDDESAEPAVRGSRPGDNIFEVDFVPSGYLFHAGGAISVFNAELVESFDIHAAAYGPEFFGVTGGVFDVKLRDPAEDRLRGSIDISILQAGVLVEGPISDNQSFYLAGRRSYLELLIKDQLEEDDGVTFVEFPNYSDYQGKYVWKPNSASTVRASINGASDSLAVNVDETSSEIDDDPLFAGRTAEKTRYDTQGIVWDLGRDSGVSVKSALVHSAASSEAQAGDVGAIEVLTDSWYAKSHVRIPVSERHELLTGVQFAHVDADITLDLNDPGCTEFEPECRFTGAERLEVDESLSINSAQVFLKDHWYITDRLTLFPGLSAHTDDLTDRSFLEPRFALEYAATDDLVWSAGLGLYHQAPGYDQINEVLGNPDLKHIRSVHGVVGVEKSFEKSWSLKTELYYKDLDLLVAGDETLRYNNSGEGEAYGLDVLVRKDLTDKWSGWLSMSFSKATRTQTETDDEFAFDFDQPFNASLVASYKASEKWRFGAKFWTHSGAPYTPVIGADADSENPGFFIPRYGSINSERLPSYQRLDLRADRTFFRTEKREVAGYLELINVLDSKNLSEYDYNRDFTERKQVSQLPLIVALGIRASF